MDLRVRERGVVVAMLMASLVGAGVVAAHPGAPASGLIHSCVDKEGKLRIVAETDTCKDKESPLDWNVQGIQGPKGDKGDPGPQGQPGLAGPGGGQPPVPSDSQMFLRIDGVPGDSQDAAHSGEIEVLSFSMPHTPAGLNVTFKGGSASGRIWQATSGGWPPGERFANVVLTVRSTGPNQVEFLRWKLENVAFMEYKTTMEAGATVPTDFVDFYWDKMTYEFRPRLADGTFGPVVSNCRSSGAPGFTCP